MGRDRFISLIFLAFGIYGFVFSVKLPMGEWQSPGPGIFPFFVSILLCILGAAWFFYGKSTNSIDKINFASFNKEIREPLKVVIVTLIFVLLLGSIGYLLGSFLYLFSILFCISRYRFWTSLVFSLALGVISWYFFGKILGVELPVGPEFFPL